MRMLIVGAGSTGGFFGARLIQAGRDVTFLVRPARAAALRADGLQVRSPHGDFTVRPSVVTRDEIAGPYDAVLVTVKAYALEQAIDDFAPAVGPDTMVVSVLNGLRHIDVLRERFGDRVLGGVARISSQLDDEGRILQFGPLNALSVGELAGGTSARVERLHAFLSGAGFDAALSTRAAQDLWDKWVMLATLGGTTCLARGTVGEIVATDGGVEFVRAFLGELLAVANAAGFGPAPAVVEAVTSMLTTAGSPMTSSMYRDQQAGQAVEVEQILGDLRRRAASYGVAVPLVTAAYVQLAAYEKRRAG